MDQFVLKGLTYPKTLLIRKAFSTVLFQVSQKVQVQGQSVLSYLLHMLISNIPEDSVSNQQAEYPEYFDLLRNLVDIDIENPSVNYEQFIVVLMDRILRHPYSEKRTSYYPDRVLVGLINLAEKIFSSLPQFKSSPQAFDFLRIAF